MHLLGAVAAAAGQQQAYIVRLQLQSPRAVHDHLEHVAHQE